MAKLDIYKRCEDFAVNIIYLIEKIPYKSSVGVIGKQLIRSSTSVGANLNEADNARSRKEFLSCLGICLKEIKETIYWLILLERTNVEYSNEIILLRREAIEIKKVIGSIYQKSKT